MTDETLYERDYALWLDTQAAALRDHRWSEVDVDHLSEEIEDLGKSQRRELASRLDVLRLHLLKVEVQPERDEPGSWWSRALEQARQVRRLLNDSPSLRSLLPTLVNDEYQSIRKQAALETRQRSGCIGRSRIGS